MVHLQKQTNTVVKGIELERMSCVNSPFIKGRVVSKVEFETIMSKRPEHVCKKCQNIFYNLK